MSSKLKVKCQKNDAGRLNWIEIYKKGRRKPLRLDFVWDADQLTREIEFSGVRRDMPSISDIMLMFNESFIERIGVVKLINLIEEIELIDTIGVVSLITEITNIKNIESLDLIDLITKISEITTVKTVDKVTLIDKISEITEVKDIKTVGADNILIDLLKKGAYIEDRRIIENHGATPSWMTVGGNERYGKFFTRGCMGLIESINVYCKSDGVVGTIKVYISPNPALGYVATATINVGAGAGADWRSATFNRMWLSDKLFIFVVCSHADIKFGYDTVENPDRYYSADIGATWTTSSHRCWFRAIMKGQSVVILPIGGTVNNVEIPHVSDERLFFERWLDSDDLITVRQVHGAGELEYLDFRINAMADSQFVSCYVYCDDKCSFLWDSAMLNEDGYTATTEGIQLLKYGVDSLCYIHCMLKFNFQRNLKICMQRKAGSPNQSIVVEGLVNLIK